MACCTLLEEFSVHLLKKIQIATSRSTSSETPERIPSETCRAILSETPRSISSENPAILKKILIDLRASSKELLDFQWNIPEKKNQELPEGFLEKILDVFIVELLEQFPVKVLKKKSNEAPWENWLEILEDLTGKSGEILS